MSDQQTLDPSPHSDSDPSLSRSLSSSRLNAGAPEFVPGGGRTTPPLPQPQRMILPPPPPPPHGVLHMYHHHHHNHQRPFNVPVLGPVPIQPHLVPPHRFNHHNRQNQHYVPVRNHQQEVESVGKKSDRRDHHKRESRNDQTSEAGGSVAIDPKTGLPEDTVQKIVNQVEYYFSDLNLATTDHLMRFISKDPEGYVPIHVVASFKKVKAVVSGNSQLATVLQNSEKLVVSEDGKKVRRVNPITEAAIEELQSRIVIAENLPEDHCYQNLMKIFSTVGSVKNIRTCQPQNTGNGGPPAARSAKSDGTLLSNKVHAFVEYETVELAEKAVAELNEVGNWRSSLKVRLMLKHQTKEPKQGQGRGRKGHDVEVEHEEDDATTSEHQQQPIEKQSEECSGEWDTHVPGQAVIGEEQGNEKAVGQRKGRSRGRGKGRGRGQPHQNQNQNQNQNHNGRGNHHNHHHQHQMGTPPSNNPMNSMEQPKQQPPGPRMPDGTRGFSMGRGKPITITVQAD